MALLIIWCKVTLLENVRAHILEKLKRSVAASPIHKNKCQVKSLTHTPVVSNIQADHGQKTQFCNPQSDECLFPECLHAHAADGDVPL